MVWCGVCGYLPVDKDSNYLPPPPSLPHACRAVLCRNAGVVYETSDHNPNVSSEEERIVAGGGNFYTTPSKQKVVQDSGNNYYVTAFY